MRPGHATTLGMVVLVGVLWGLNWPAVKYLLSEITPLSLRAFGFTSAALALFVIAKTLRHRLKPAPGEAASLLLTGVFVLFGFNILTVLGQLFTPASNAAIIAYTMPAMTAMLSVVILGETLHRSQVLAILISLLGLGLLASADLAQLVSAPAGPLLMLGAALSWALGNVLMQSRAWTLSPLARAMWFFVISAVLTWPLMLTFEPRDGLALPSPAFVWLFAFHVCGPMVACYVLWTIILGRLSATVATLSTLIAPVVGVMSSVLLLGEGMNWQKAVALILIVLSIAMSLRRPKT